MKRKSAALPHPARLSRLKTNPAARAGQERILNKWQLVADFARDNQSYVPEVRFGHPRRAHHSMKFLRFTGGFAKHRKARLVSEESGLTGRCGNAPRQCAGSRRSGVRSCPYGGGSMKWLGAATWRDNGKTKRLKGGPHTAVLSLEERHTDITQMRGDNRRRGQQHFPLISQPRRWSPDLSASWRRNQSWSANSLWLLPTAAGTAPAVLRLHRRI